MLVASHLTRFLYDKQRGEFAAVNDISFSIAPGQVFGLLGPNGAGKTTTLRMTAGLMKPSAGSIELNGKTLDDSAESRRSLGFLSAATGLYERLTVREMLRYVGRLCDYPLDKLTGRIDQLIAALQMQEYADVRCDKLSTGMRQKVSIARSVVHDPTLIILDEPTSGLDVIAKCSIYDFINDCRRRGKIILFSTHLMNEAEKLCDVIGILHRGQLFAVGTLDELRQRTGQHYLEDIFLTLIKEEAIEAV